VKRAPRGYSMGQMGSAGRAMAEHPFLYLLPCDYIVHTVVRGKHPSIVGVLHGANGATCETLGSAFCA